MTEDKLDINNYLFAYIFSIFFIILIFCFKLDVNFLFNFLSTIEIPTFFYIITLLFNHFLSSEQKFMIVFRKFENYYPACEAFSEHIEKDFRVDYNIINEKYGPLPLDLGEQNKLWYKIYKKRHNVSMIVNSQRNFLIFRDVACLTLIIIINIIILILLSFIFNFINIKYNNIYFLLGVLSILFILLDIRANDLGIKFVKDVLAEASMDDII